MADEYGKISFFNGTDMDVLLSFQREDGSEIQVTPIAVDSIVTQLTPVGATWSLTMVHEYVVGAEKAGMVVKVSPAAPSLPGTEPPPGETQLGKGSWLVTVRYVVVALEAETAYLILPNGTNSVQLLPGDPTAPFRLLEPENAEAFGTRRS